MTGQDDDIRPVTRDEEIHHPFDVQAQTGQYSMWKLLGALAFLIVLALIVFFVYQPGARDRTDPVVISPSKTALKVPPPEEQIDPQNNNAIYGANSANNAPETITTREPEKPIELPKTVTIVDGGNNVATTPAQTQAPQKPVVSAPASSKPLPPGSQGNAQGTYLVQVASLRSYEEAEAAWNLLTRKFSFLKGQLYDIKRVDLAEKGVYYRLRIDGLSSREYAATVCNKLKASGQACFRTSR